MCMLLCVVKGRKLHAHRAHHDISLLCAQRPAFATSSPLQQLIRGYCGVLRQVKVAEHVLTSHKVAIKILNRKKIKQMDMEEKGAAPSTGAEAAAHSFPFMAVAQ